MKARIVTSLSALLGAGAVLVLITDLWPDARAWAEDHWWVGWFVAILFLATAVVLFDASEWDRTARTRAKAAESKQSELAEEVDSLQARVRAFAPAPHPSRKDPILRISGRAHEGTTYTLSNHNDFYAIYDIEIHSATPGVEVVEITNTYLQPGGDMAIVNVEFADGTPIPWRAIINYQIRKPLSSESNLQG